MENKLDKLVEAMSKLIRFEEKMAQHDVANERFIMRLDDLEDRIELIEKKMPLVNLLLNSVGKVGIAILTLVVGGIVASYFVF